MYYQTKFTFCEIAIIAKLVQLCPIADSTAASTTSATTKRSGEEWILRPNLHKCQFLWLNCACSVDESSWQNLFVVCGFVHGYQYVRILCRFRQVYIYVDTFI